MSFQLTSKYKPTGDQPEAIAQLSQGVRDGLPHQTLLGVTGSGKTFTIANVIQQVDRPTLVISHNKTLAAQLYSEFKAFFPNNAVEYFVSYYDYYQPEAYLINTDTYIEKDMAINAELDKLRLRATASLLSGRRDVIVVASVSCIYGMANPNDFENAEGNLGIANAILEHLAVKLPVSRLQRDLTDSTVLRNVGVPFGHIIIAIQSSLKGLRKLLLNETAIYRDLDNCWSVVAEAIQTILRREAYPHPYEALKALTRTNQAITENSIKEFIEELNVSEDIKKELRAITPHTYTGL